MLASEVAEWIGTNVTSCSFDTTGVSGNVFISTLPSSPDTVVMVSEYGGIVDDKNPFSDINVQTRIRGTKDPRVGYNIAKEIFDELQGLTNTTLISSGKHVVKVNALNTPIDIGRDDNGRHEWTVNFQIEVRDVGTNRS
tara:strand:- start:4849 stop:5265 length:417 start_codon:yes stop_codon:yes gene_type:complete